MNSSNEFRDTDSFYANVDRLVKVIKITLSKDQTRNAEHYVKYFFEVFVKFYLKERSIQNSNSIDEQSPLVRKIDQEEVIIYKFRKQISHRTTQRGHDAFFSDKINSLLCDNIRPDRFDLFHFVLKVYQDSIKFLLSEEKNVARLASRLMSNFKFIAAKVVNLDPSLDTYERNWFQDEVFEWFITFYSSLEFNKNYLDAIENEILYICRLIIDNDKPDIFKRFLHRLSTASFTSNFFFERSLQDLLGDDQLLKRQVIRLVDEQVYSQSSVETNKDFQASFSKLDSVFVGRLAAAGISKNMVDEIINLTKQRLFEVFKKKYLKTILLKILVYSFFKGETKYFLQYLNYHQPEDADATWAGESYTIKTIPEAIQVLIDSEAILDRTNFFWIEHHGFSVYLHTIVAYFLYTLTDKNNLNNVSLQESDYNKLIGLSYKLKQLKSNIKGNLLNKIVKNFDSELYNNIIDAYIKEADRKIEDADFKHVTTSMVSENVVSYFTNSFVEKYRESSVLKAVLSKLEKVKKINEINLEPAMGINQLVDKQMFIEDPRVTFLDSSGAFAESFASSEDLNIGIAISKGFDTLEMDKTEFKNFIRDSKGKYDLLFVKGRYLNRYDFPELDFKEEWSIDQGFYKGVADYLGILDSHYNVFFLRPFPYEEYTFVNSADLGYLNQYLPPTLPNGLSIEEFSFSIIDLSTDNESRKKLLESGKHEEKDLMKNVWLRIFESYNFQNSTKVQGINIKVLGF